MRDAFALPDASSSEQTHQPACKAAAANTGFDLDFHKEPTLEEIKEMYLEYLIARHRGHRGRIAAILGVSERNTYRMVKKFGLEEK